MNQAPSKVELRHRLKSELTRLSTAELVLGGSEICARLRSQPIWSTAESILFYMPTRREPNIWPLVTETLARGRRVTLPRYSIPEDRYVVCVVENVDRDLSPGHFRIPEPTSACPAFDVKQLDLALIPGIGFTLDGGRLGRGKGYYDRLLAEVPGFKCGVAFDCQVTAELPVEPHDVRLNCILTPTRWYVVSSQPRS